MRAEGQRMKMHCKRVDQNEYKRLGNSAHKDEHTHRFTKHEEKKT